MTTIDKRRKAMVDRQVAARGIDDHHVLTAMRIVPREAFVSEKMAKFAYDDAPLPIGAGQTISQPYIVALMIEAAKLTANDRVLEIGAGSGYAAAVMSRIAHRIYAIERHPDLAERARERMAVLGYDNVVIGTADGSNGWPENAPFDAILVAAGAPQMPSPLPAQLAVGGRLVIPIGNTDLQRLIRVTRSSEGAYEEEDLGGVRFVPLIGVYGWKDDSR